jgi:hypothetical protein
VTVLKFTMSIYATGAAMQSPEEVAEELRKIAERLEHGDGEGKIKDINGNRVGEFDLEREDWD